MKINITREEWAEMLTNEWMEEFGTPFVTHGPALVIMARSLVPTPAMADYMGNLASHKDSLLVIVEDA